MQGEKISVVIPMYNAESQIKKCINSMLRQTYPDYEIIVVNDGSTDDSLAVCKSAYDGEPHVTIIDKPNGGVSDARNAGIQAASGKYIAFADADDWAEPTYLSCLYEHLIQDGADICAGDYKVETTNPQKENAKVDVHKKRVVTGPEILERFFDVQISTSVWGKLFRRDLIEDLQFPAGMKIGEDALFVYHALRRAKTVSIIPEQLYVYWIDNTNSITNNYSARFDYDTVHFSTLILKDVQENIPDMLPSACNFLMQQTMPAYLHYIHDKKEKMDRFQELSKTLQIIFRYADHSNKYYKYRFFYLLHKVCRPLGRALVK